MANWNLSVDLRGHGNDLAQALKSAAKNARSLGSAARTAKTEVKELGTAAEAAGRKIRTLGRDAQTAARHVNTLGDRAQTAGRRLSRYGDAARNANTHLTSLGSHSRTAGRDLARMSGQIDTAIRDLMRLASAARTADSRLNGLGDRGLRGVRRYREETSRLRESMKSLAGLAALGGVTLGAAEVVKEGKEYQQAMNAFGATTNATQMQMHRAAATASQLGADLKLPGSTAADAAEAMLELAKAGFRTDQAISASRASLVLASAAQVNAADSAKYLGDMMDQFGLGADQAGKAADTLAATANAASGDIIDIYYAMKYAGPVAHGLGVNMQEAAAAVGMLGKAGILGQTAGTTLRGMMANLASPTPQMIEGLKAMGIEAFDAQGKFKGLRYVIDGLSKAQKQMTQKDFAAAVKKSMGKPAMAGAIALAHQGTESFDAMMQAVSQTGAASQIAAAKGKGLAGALLQLKTQAKQTGLTIYQGMAPGLEFLTRGVTAGLSRATPHIEHFFKYLNDAATLFGPDIAAAARKEFSGIADAAKGLAEPFKDLGGQAVADFLHVLLSAGQAAIEILVNLDHAVEPVVGALGNLSGESGTVASTLDLVVTAIDLAATAVGALSSVLVPIGHLVGTLVTAFGGLPGPIQQFVLAALLVSRIQPRMAALAGTVSGRVTGAFRSLGEQMQVQRTLAAAAGQSLSRYGAAMAVLQTRIPVIGRMGDSFRTAAAQSTGFAATLRGVTAAAGTGLRGAMSGLMGAMGGPWGVALTGLTVGLGLLASSQQAAAARAAEHKANIDGLTQAMRQSNGVIDESVRQQAAQTIQNTKLSGSSQTLAGVMGKLGYSLSDLTDSYLGQGESIDTLSKKMFDLAKARGAEALAKGPHNVDKSIMAEADAYAAAGKALQGMSGDAKTAAQNARELDAATRGNGDGVSAYSRLKDAVAALAEKTGDADSRTRALRQALDLLSGGSVSLQAAQARVNEAITQANDALKNGIDRADGYGKALLNTNGTLNTTTKNGQNLFNTINTIADGTANAAIAAFDFAQSQGKDLPESLKAARQEIEKNRKSVIDMAPAYGLTAEQMGKVADSLGLIPGQVSILLSTKGVDGTLADLIAVQAEFQKVPNSKTIKVDSLSEDAKKDLQDLGYKIELIPGTREYKITAPTKDARDQLDKLITEMSKVPDGKDVSVTASNQMAIQGLNDVIAKIRATPGAKSVTVKTLNATAIKALEDVGFTVTHLPDGSVTVSAKTGTALGNIGAVQGAVNSLQDRTVTVSVITRYSTIGGGDNNHNGIPDSVEYRARGGLVQRFADGGQPVQYIPFGGPVVGPGTGTSDSIPALISNGEYVIKASAVRKYGVAMFDRLNAGRYASGGLGGKSDGIPRFAGGGFTYTPTESTRARIDTGTVSSWYDSDIQHLKDAWDKLNEALRAQAKHSTKATRKAVAEARAAVNAADAALGLKKGTKTPHGFSLTGYGANLAEAVRKSDAWERNLKKIGQRAGGDVEEILRGMGEDGRALVASLAKASGKTFNQIVANLRKLAPLAKATLADYTAQLNASNKTSAAFQANLAKLASMGYGDLATQLAGQGDEAAQKIAAEAVKSKGAASKANKAAKTNAKTLDSDQLAELVQIIAAITSSKTGLHDVAGKTGLGEDEIITVANLAKGQIQSSLGGRASRFLSDLGKANKGLAYAQGGIREGIYATQGGLVRFAEPSTRGEAYIPLAADRRRNATAVLADVAGRFGLGLTDANAGRVVIIREQAPLVGSQTWHVTSGGSATDTAREIESRTGYQLRRLARGGVASR